MGARFLDRLLGQEGENDPDIRALSLDTLIDSPALALAGLFWTQFCWLFAWWVSGWTWILPIVALDLALFAARWPLLKRGTLGGKLTNRRSVAGLVTMNVGLLSLAAFETYVLTQVPAEQGATLAIILSMGFCAYVVAFFPAFPILATLNVVILNGALTIGLSTGWSETLRPFGLLIPNGTLLHWLMIQRTHKTLLAALRNQDTNRRLALLDSLTKLPNRAAMWDALQGHLARLGRDPVDAGMAVLYLDLDGFKSVNDRFGHAAGDWVLVQVAEVLRRALLRDETVYRIGGDEFVAILPFADEARVDAFARFAIEAVARPLDLGGSVPARVGLSLGAVIARNDSRSAEDVLAAADAALYASKRNGRGQLTLHSGGVEAVAA